MIVMSFISCSIFEGSPVAGGSSSGATRRRYAPLFTVVGYRLSVDLGALGLPEAGREPSTDNRQPRNQPVSASGAVTPR
jgi:hypothetical protein